MARKHDTKGRSTGGEHWTKLVRNTMEEPAWKALSSTAQALYPWLKLEWRGLEYNNNGKLRLSVRQAASRLGVALNTAAEAFRDLQRKGFIVQTEHACLGVDGAAKSPAYEITELKMPGAEGDGRKLYRNWKPGHDLHVHMLSANNPGGIHGKKTKPRLKNEDSAVLKTKTNKGDTVLKTDTACLKNYDEKRDLEPLTVLEIETSLPTIPIAPRGGSQAKRRSAAQRAVSKEYFSRAEARRAQARDAEARIRAVFADIDATVADSGGSHGSA